jgi:peroxiredoxin
MGKRTLLKFYRGSWCPYCNAELAMFRDMQPELSAYDVNILALSGDTPQQEKAHVERDKLNFTLLSDPTLAIVKQYGVEHHKAVGWESNNIKTIFGLSMSFSMLQYRSMPIPTSILIDENGIIKWIDQSDDYRLRASQEKIVAAIKHSFQA